MTKAVEAHIVSAFVDERKGGNLAGVVLDRTDLSEAQMQDVARQLALSETVFVRAAPDGFRLDFFTPNKRVPDCGHATVAAFGLLSERRRIAGTQTVKHTVNGPRDMRVDSAGIFMQQPAATYATAADEDGIVASLGLTGGDLAAAPAAARHDVGFLIVPVLDAAILSRLAPDMSKISAISDLLDVIGYYVYAPGKNGLDATVRMFAPSFGIPEESATGMAAGLLSAYLYDRGGSKRETYTIEQGAYMSPPSPSVIQTRPVLRDGVITEVWVGGRASVIEQREVRVAD